MLIEFGVTFLLNFSLLLKAELIIELVLYLLLVEQTNMFYLKIRWLLKDTHKAKHPQIKLKRIRKVYLTMYIWAIVILNQLFTRESYTQIRFSKKEKNEAVNGKSPHRVKHRNFP